MNCAIIVFQGTNCDVDTYRACELMEWSPKYVWHDETDLSSFDLVILPGGLSETGSLVHSRLAKLSPVMKALKEYINQERGFVLGICNGFKMLCEEGFLPGALLANSKNKFICDDIEFIFTEYNVNRTIVLPIAHSEGKYYADPKTLTELEDKDMVFLTYKLNPNGSICNIAGIYDREKKIIGITARPERAFHKELKLTDGRRIFDFIKSELDDARSKAV